MNKGINLALNNENLKRTLRSEISNLLNEKESLIKEKCIFISYKSEDKDSAKIIADYIMELGVDVFFDIYNINPKNSNSQKEVTVIINEALLNCTHMICLISKKTKESWWVPYEIGFAIGSGKIISNNLYLLLHKDIDIMILPEYLHSTNKIKNHKDLQKIIKTISQNNINESIKTFLEFNNQKIFEVLKSE